MDTKILLENGTNELEVLEFELDGNPYGINVSESYTGTKCASQYRRYLYAERYDDHSN